MRKKCMKRGNYFYSNTIPVTSIPPNKEDPHIRRQHPLPILPTNALPFVPDTWIPDSNRLKRTDQRSVKLVKR